MSLASDAHALVVRTTAAQGLPERLTDASALAKLAVVLRPGVSPSASSTPKRHLRLVHVDLASSLRREASP